MLLTKKKTNSFLNISFVRHDTIEETKSVSYFRYSANHHVSNFTIESSIKLNTT